MQPRLGELQIFVKRRSRYAELLGGLVIRKPAKKHQLDRLGKTRFVRGQLVERDIEFENIGEVVAAYDFDSDASRIYALSREFSRSAWEVVGARSADLRSFRDQGGR